MEEEKALTWKIVAEWAEAQKLVSAVSAPLL